MKVITHHGDFIPYNFDLRSPEVLQRDNACETRAVEEVARVGQTVDR